MFQINPMTAASGPLFKAIEESSFKEAEEIVKGGADLLGTSIKGQTLLQEALLGQKGAEKLIDLLIFSGASYSCLNSAQVSELCDSRLSKAFYFRQKEKYEQAILLFHEHVKIAQNAVLARVSEINSLGLHLILQEPLRVLILSYEP